MKKILYALSIAFAALLMGGCGGQNETYSEFLGDGPIVYIGKADTVKVFPGRGRLMLTWLEQSDPRAKKAIIYWGNRTGNKEVALTPGERTETVIENLEEGSYVFEIFTQDNHGNSSVKVEAVGTVYGEGYESTLMNRNVSAFSYAAETKTATVTFRKSSHSDLEATEIVYTDDQGAERTFVLEKGQDKAVISPYEGASFEFRAVYKPDVLSIDDFYSTSATYQTPDAVSAP